MPLVGPYDLKTGLKVQIKALTSSLEHLEFIPRLFVCTLYILYGHHLSKKSKNLKKKIFFSGKIWPLGWVLGHRKMQKNAKFGCFDHLGFHQIHVFEQSYTKQWSDKAIFDQRKNNFFAQNWPW